MTLSCVAKGDASWIARVAARGKTAGASGPAEKDYCITKEHEPLSLIQQGGEIFETIGCVPILLIFESAY